MPMDTYAKWKADALERERQLKEEREQLSAQEREQVASVEQMIRAAITHAIVEERTFLVQLIGTALGEALDAEREEAKKELSDEVRRLWAVLSEIQSTITSINRMALATNGKSLTNEPDPLSRSH
jgi:hypothetical protein